MIITIPHSSNRVPEEIRGKLALGEEEVSNSWDLGSSEIYGALPVRYIVQAKYSRIAADLNRSPRTEGPKGVVPLSDYSGRSIYLDGFVLTEEETKRRLKVYYWPFHRRIERLVREGRGMGIIDCHTLNGIGPKKAPDCGKRRPDVV
ncbi:MAG: N-formylglutamate amidohydrolase, partial [Desulfatiglandales bacterium]